MQHIFKCMHHFQEVSTSENLCLSALEVKTRTSVEDLPQFWLSDFLRHFVFTRESRMLRASLPSSVRLSVTLVNCIKTVQARITKSSPWAAPRSLVYRDKISSHWVQGFPSNEGVEEGYPLKRRHFAVIG